MSLSSGLNVVSERSSWYGYYHNNRAVAYILLAQVFATVMGVATRLLELPNDQGIAMHPFQILFVRFAISTVLSTAYMWYAEIPHFPFGLPEVRWLLGARGVGSFFGVLGFYYSLRYLPLADATVFTFIAPSLSCFACSILLHEPFTRMERIGTVVSFFGVILIAQPHALFHTRASAPATGAPVADIEARDVIAVTPAQRFGAICMALVGVVGSAMAFTAMRSLGKRAHPLFSVNYYSVVCLVASGVVLASVPSISFSLPAGLKEWVYLIVLSCSGFAMQLLLSAGLQMEKSSRATNMVYTQMFFASVSDKLIFGLNPTILGLLGSSLILTSAVYVAVQKEAIKQRQAEEKARRAANSEVAGDLEMQAAAAATAVDVHRFTLATVSEDDDGEGEVAEETDPFMTSIADTKGSTLRD